MSEANGANQDRDGRRGPHNRHHPNPGSGWVGYGCVADIRQPVGLRPACRRAGLRPGRSISSDDIWDEDVTGRLLAREVLQAADRGVRVRLLLDDLYVRRTERALATLEQHPCIEVRLYNPFQLRSWGALGNAVEFLFAGYRLNHRMHNKTWIVDRQLPLEVAATSATSTSTPPTSSTSATSTSL